MSFVPWGISSENLLDYAVSDIYFEQIEANTLSVEYKMHPSWLHVRGCNPNIHTSEAAEQTDDQLDHKESQEGPLDLGRYFYILSQKPVCKVYWLILIFVLDLLKKWDIYSRWYNIKGLL